MHTLTAVSSWLMYVMKAILDLSYETHQSDGETKQLVSTIPLALAFRKFEFNIVDSVGGSALSILLLGS